MRSGKFYLKHRTEMNRIGCQLRTPSSSSDSRQGVGSCPSLSHHGWFRAHTASRPRGTDGWSCHSLLANEKD